MHIMKRKMRTCLWGKDSRKKAMMGSREEEGRQVCFLTNKKTLEWKTLAKSRIHTKHDEWGPRKWRKLGSLGEP